MKPGISALASFDDRRIDQSDVESLDIELEHSPRFGFRIDDHGDVPEPYRSSGCITLLLGEIDNPAEIATKLGLSRPRRPAEIAFLALSQWQERLSLEMPGFWTLVQWDEDRKRCTIASSFGLRDPLIVAVSGSKFALAPSVSRLADLGWVSRDIDPDSFTLSAMRWKARRDHLDPVIVKNVKRLEPGSVHVFDASGHTKSPRPRPQLSLFQGTFEEAADQLEAAARSVVGRIMAGHETVAILLSGGLDSSLVSLFAAQEARAGQRVVAVSSVSLPEANAPDERSYIDIVARSLGIDVVYVSPPNDVEFLEPHETTMMQRESPAIASNHFVYRHLMKAAREAGATVCLGGEFGEAHFTRWPTNNLKPGLRGHARNLLSRIKRNRSVPEPFLFWPSEEIRSHALSIQEAQVSDLEAERGLFGFGDIYEKAGRLSTQSTESGIRYYRIFETEALFHLSAGFPDHFSQQNGQSRALARHILGKHLPEAIANRQDKGPISPDFRYRMTSFLAEAEQRLVDYRQLELDRWIDIERIAATLTTIKKGDQKIANGQLRQLQTAINAAEFISWWVSRA